MKCIDWLSRENSKLPSKFEISAGKKSWLGSEFLISLESNLTV